MPGHILAAQLRPGHVPVPARALHAAQGGPQALPGAAAREVLLRGAPHASRLCVLVKHVYAHKPFNVGSTAGSTLHVDMSIIGEYGLLHHPIIGLVYCLAVLLLVVVSAEGRLHVPLPVISLCMLASDSLDRPVED